jgi:glycosyltransferase involved in cell wall biosynthesis
MIPPYRYPIFSAVVADRRWRLRFLLTSQRHHTDARAWRELDAVHVRTIHILHTTHHQGSGAVQQEPVALPISLIWQLLRYRPGVILAGEMGVRSLICWFAAGIVGAKLVIWSEEIASSAASRSRLQNAIRRVLLRHAVGFLAWGQPAADYLRQVGVAERTIFVGAQAIDNDWWLRQARETDGAAARDRLGLRGVVFLTVSRLVRRKGIRELLAAAAQLRKDGLQATFVIIGGGEEQSELVRDCKERGLSNVLLTGPKPREELPQWYAAANAFVFPSLEDVWGLVVNEALCFGLYVLGSKWAGACQQLLTSPELGRCVDPSDSGVLVAALRELTLCPPRPDARRAKAVRDITFWKSREAILGALEFAIGGLDSQT